MPKLFHLCLALLALAALVAAAPGPGTCNCGRNDNHQVASCDTAECYNVCSFFAGNGNSGKCTTNKKFSAVQSMLTQAAAFNADAATALMQEAKVHYRACIEIQIVCCVLPKTKTKNARMAEIVTGFQEKEKKHLRPSVASSDIASQAAEQEAAAVRAAAQDAAYRAAFAKAKSLSMRVAAMGGAVADEAAFYVCNCNGVNQVCVTDETAKARRCGNH